MIVVGRIIGTLQTVWVVAFIIIFQPELRSALTNLGLRRGFGLFQAQVEIPAEQELLEAVTRLSRRGLGALIVIENLIDDARRENAFGLLMSLNMLIEFGDAFDYTGADFRDPFFAFGGLCGDLGVGLRGGVIEVGLNLGLRLADDALRLGTGIGLHVWSGQIHEEHLVYASLPK